MQAYLNLFNLVKYAKYNYKTYWVLNDSYAGLFLLPDL